MHLFDLLDKRRAIKRASDCSDARLSDSDPLSRVSLFCWVITKEAQACFKTFINQISQCTGAFICGISAETFQQLQHRHMFRVQVHPSRRTDPTTHVGGRRVSDTGTYTQLVFKVTCNHTHTFCQ